MPAPDASSRKTCWQARDNYYECKEQHSANEEQCKQLRELFEKNCLPSWVKHFDRKRVYEEYKKKLNTEGYKLTQE